MNLSNERRLAARAKDLGEGASAEALPELASLVRSESPLVRRLAASALGKLAGIVDSAASVGLLRPLLADGHPQVRQYAAKALGAFGAEAAGALPDLRDLYRNPAEKDYVKRTVVAFRYDNRFRIIKGYAIRPDFYLPEFDLYVEYWGMEGNLDYEIGMLEKKKLYQQAGKRLVSLYARDKPRLREALREKLSRHAVLPTPSGDAVERPRGRETSPCLPAPTGERPPPDVNLEETPNPNERTEP